MNEKDYVCSDSSSQQLCYPPLKLVQNIEKPKPIPMWLDQQGPQFKKKIKQHQKWIAQLVYSNQYQANNQEIKNKQLYISPSDKQNLEIQDLALSSASHEEGQIILNQQYQLQKEPAQNCIKPIMNSLLDQAKEVNNFRKQICQQQIKIFNSQKIQYQQDEVQILMHYKKKQVQTQEVWPKVVNNKKEQYYEQGQLPKVHEQQPQEQEERELVDTFQEFRNKKTNYIKTKPKQQKIIVKSIFSNTATNQITLYDNVEKVPFQAVVYVSRFQTCNCAQYHKGKSCRHMDFVLKRIIKINMQLYKLPNGNLKKEAPQKIRQAVNFYFQYRTRSKQALQFCSNKKLKNFEKDIAKICYICACPIECFKQQSTFQENEVKSMNLQILKFGCSNCGCEFHQWCAMEWAYNLKIMSCPVCKTPTVNPQDVKPCQKRQPGLKERMYIIGIITRDLFTWQIRMIDDWLHETKVTYIDQEFYCSCYYFFLTKNPCKHITFILAKAANLKHQVEKTLHKIELLLECKRKILYQLFRVFKTFQSRQLAPNYDQLFPIKGKEQQFFQNHMYRNLFFGKCYICFENIERESNLIAIQIQCKNDNQYFHKICLQAWREAHNAEFQCPRCSIKKVYLIKGLQGYQQPKDMPFFQEQRQTVVSFENRSEDKKTQTGKKSLENLKYIPKYVSITKEKQVSRQKQKIRKIVKK